MKSSVLLVSSLISPQSSSVQGLGYTHAKLLPSCISHRKSGSGTGVKVGRSSISISWSSCISNWEGIRVSWVSGMDVGHSSCSYLVGPWMNVACVYFPSCSFRLLFVVVEGCMWTACQWEWVFTILSSTGQTVRTFFASFLAGAVFASPAGVSPAAYDGHATAHKTKSERLTDNLG